MKKDWSEHLLMLRQMEMMKTYSRFNIVFSIVVFVIVLLQVAFLVRLDFGSNEAGFGAAMIYDYADQYVNNIAFTFIPILVLLNVGREFEYAVVQRSLVSGLSRRDYFLAKLIQLGMLSLYASFLACVFMLMTALLHNVPVKLNPEKIAMYAVVAFCLGSLSLLIALVVRKRIYSLFVFIIYVLAENTYVTVIGGKTTLLPVQTCTRMLRQGIYEWPGFLMLAAYTFIFLSTAYQKLMRSDLR